MAKTGSQVDEAFGEKIVQLLIMMFQNVKRVTESGLLAYQGVCVGMSGRVNIKDFGQYIYWALEGEDEDCTRVACGIISDIVAALQMEAE